MSVEEEIKKLYGIESPPIVGVDAVSKEMIRHWCEAMEDENPLHQDEEYAKRHIKATLDTEHIGLWKRYFVRKPGEAEKD
jgi:hypothetical protein